MTSKELVDKHFNKGYGAYSRICWKYYKGRYLYEDLLHEMYLKMIASPEATVFRLSAVDKLHYLGLRLIGSIYSRRTISCNRASQYYEGSNNSSPLFETPGVSFEYDFLMSDQGPDEQEIQVNFEKAQKAITLALQEPVMNTKNKSKFLKVTTFLAVEASNINAIHKKTGISRPYLTQTYNEARDYLKQEILK